MSWPRRLAAIAARLVSVIMRRMPGSAAGRGPGGGTALGLVAPADIQLGWSAAGRGGATGCQDRRSDIASASQSNAANMR